MVERIMLFKLHEPSAREALASQAVEALARINELEEVSVGLPADAASEKSWDLSVVIGVANLALLNAVLESDGFRLFLEGVMKDRYQVTKAWSFERLG